MKWLIYLETLKKQRFTSAVSFTGSINVKVCNLDTSWDILL